MRKVCKGVFAGVLALVSVFFIEQPTVSAAKEEALTDSAYVSDTQTANESIVSAGICSDLGVTLDESQLAARFSSTDIQTEESDAIETASSGETVTQEESESESEWSDRVMANVKKYVNIRKEASTDSDVVGKLYKGAGAEIIERGEEWTKISSGSVTGYVSNDYVAFEEQAEELAEKYGKECAVVTTQALRIRKEASEEAAIINIAVKDQQLEVDKEAEETEGWVAVKYGKGTYYVADQYVDVDLVVDKAISIEEEQAAIAAAEAAKKASSSSSSSGTAKTQGSSVSASADETTLLAAIIYCEAGNESYEGKVAVGAVVVNRVKSSSYPNTVKGVIYQSGQFSPVASGKFAKVLSSHSYTSSCVSAAKEALSGVSNVGSAKSFRMVSSGHSGQRIGGHVFF
jgi:hypothetical protein